MYFVDRITHEGVILMDGALGTELERRGVPVDTKSWSAVSMIEHADVVRAVHADYVRAGADLHIVNSFALGRQVLEPAGFGDQVVAFNQRAVKLCKQAILDSDADRPLWIAGSLSTFADNSDRTKLPQGPTLRANYREQAAILQEAGVDLLAIETLCDVDISLDAIAGALPTGLPLILGFTCHWSDDGKTVETRPGVGVPPIPLTKVLDALIPEVPSDTTVIYAIMHSDFDVTDAGLIELKEKWTGPTAVYPNSGRFNNLRLDFDGVCLPEHFVYAANNWIEAGANIVGGCCGLGPKHIEALRDHIKRMNSD